MGHTTVYLTALKVRPERIEDLERILDLRARGFSTLEDFAAALQEELPHLKDVFVPEGVGVFLNSVEPYLDEEGHLYLGTVENGGWREEALLLSHFVEPGEVIALADDHESLYGYRVVREGEVEALKGALVNEKGEVVWTE